MTDSLLSEFDTKAPKSNRLDPPHDLMLANGPVEAAEASAPWMSLAGRDPSTASDQLDRQTTELLAYVQQQNDEIDARQSELNAKLAQLDNDLRAARLKTGLDSGMELIPNVVPFDTGLALDELPLTQPTEPPTTPANVPQPSPTIPPTTSPEQNTERSTEQNAPRIDSSQEFEEVERLVAQFSNTTPTVEDRFIREDQSHAEHVDAKPIEAIETIEEEPAPAEAVAPVEVAEVVDVAEEPKPTVMEAPATNDEVEEQCAAVEPFPRNALEQFVGTERFRRRHSSDGIVA